MSRTQTLPSLCSRDARRNMAPTTTASMTRSVVWHLFLANMSLTYPNMSRLSQTSVDMETVKMLVGQKYTFVISGNLVCARVLLHVFRHWGSLGQQWQTKRDRKGLHKPKLLSLRTRKLNCYESFIFFSEPLHGMFLSLFLTHVSFCF